MVGGKGGEMGDFTIRPAVSGDMEAVAAIYDHEVRHGLASFEEEPPDAAEMERRRQRVIGGGFVWLVAEAGDEVLGYAYASAYRPRPAYRFTVENTVYVARGARGEGVGRALLERLIAECAAIGFRQMIAVIGDSGNAGSIALHAACGFRRVGVLEAVGFKHGRWVDSVLMQRALGDGGDAPPGQMR